MPEQHQPNAKDQYDAFMAQLAAGAHLDPTIIPFEQGKPARVLQPFDETSFPVAQGTVLTEAEITACAKASLDNAGNLHQWLFARAIEAAVLAKFGAPVAYRTLVGDYGDYQKFNYDTTAGEQALYRLDRQHTMESETIRD